MHARFALLISAAFAVGLWAMPAQAQLESCGNIHVEASAMCVVEVEGGCEARCTPISFTASCAADLYVGCEGGCSASASVDCMASCNVSDCVTRCEVDPGGFDCQAECTAMISAQCEANCSAMAGDNMARARCEASCSATYESECSASCTARPPSADCMTSCTASCEGSCTAEANVDCQVMCQADGYIDCEASLMGGCMAECTEPEGALFCDDQYVDHGGNLEMCIDALNAILDIEVDASASGSCTSMPGGASCMGMAEASASCSAAWGRHGQGGAGFGALFVALLMVARRRRS